MLLLPKYLLPLYYKLRLATIYSYLDERFGNSSYKTGASFFLLSRTIGSAFRLFLMANVLQMTVFDAWNIPFALTVFVTLCLIWLYTYRGGIKTIIWTDTLQTVVMLATLVLTIVYIGRSLDLNSGA